MECFVCGKKIKEGETYIEKGFKYHLNCTYYTGTSRHNAVEFSKYGWLIKRNEVNSVSQEEKDEQRW